MTHRWWTDVIEGLTVLFAFFSFIEWSFEMALKRRDRLTSDTEKSC
jgi:hypothetical protein